MGGLGSECSTALNRLPQIKQNVSGFFSNRKRDALAANLCLLRERREGSDG